MSKINQILTEWLAGDIHSLKWLGQRGVGQNLAYEYFKNGSLEKLGPGIYSRKNEDIKWEAGVRLLQEELGKNIHVSGMTALELQGHTHYLPLKKERIVHLTTYREDKIPKWFYKLGLNCKFRFSRLSLFKGDVELTKYKDPSGLNIMISSRELAILEFLNVLDLSSNFETAENYMNTLQTLRPKVVQDLLEKCTSIKVKRVFLYLSESLELPFMSRLDLGNIDLGTGKRQIVKENAQLDKKYQITVPKEPEENPF